MMNDEAKALALKTHAEAFKEFKAYMGNNKPALDKYYSNLVKKQVSIVLKNIEHVYPTDSRSAEFLRLVQHHTKAI
jgi:hypothetical protein